MTSATQKQQRRANRILRAFGRYVNKAARADLLGPRTFGANIDEPTIARTKPRAFARIKRGVAWRLMARGKGDK